ncbi:MAG: MFS transporter [Candidatus Micrarchaeaceae archaeon]
MGSPHGIEKQKSTFYRVYLIVVAMLGWGMASMNFNILTSTLPAIRASLHFSVADAGLLTTIIYIGMFLVSLGFGPLIDRFGRKLTFQVTLLISSIFTGLTSITTSFGTFALTRFVADGGSFAELPTGLTIVSEEVPKKYRGLLYGFVQGGWQVGLFLSSALYLLLGPRFGWRPVYLIGAIPLVVIIIARLFVKETDRFSDLQKAEKDPNYVPQYRANLSAAKENSFKQVFSRDVMRTGKWPIISYFTETLGFIPIGVLISLFFSGYFKLGYFQIATILTISAAIAYFAYPLSGWIGDVIGRKYGLTLAIALQTIMAILFIKLAVPGNYLSVLSLYIPLNFATGMYAGNGFIYAAESYPTRVRGTGTALVMAMIAVGYAIGSAVFTVLFTLTSGNYVLTWLISAVGFSLLSTVLTALGHNVVRTQELEDIVV